MENKITNRRSLNVFERQVHKIYVVSYFYRQFIDKILQWTVIIIFSLSILILCEWYAVNTHTWSFLCPRHSKNGGGALSVTSVRACVRSSVRSSVRVSVRPSVIKSWCPLNNFWKNAWIQFKFGMLIYNIKTQVKFDLGYNPLIVDGVIGLL